MDKNPTINGSPMYITPDPFAVAHLRPLWDEFMTKCSDSDYVVSFTKWIQFNLQSFGGNLDDPSGFNDPPKGCCAHYEDCIHFLSNDL